MCVCCVIGASPVPPAVCDGCSCEGKLSSLILHQQQRGTESWRVCVCMCVCVCVCVCVCESETVCALSPLPSNWWLLRGCGTAGQSSREAVVQPPLTPIRHKAKSLLLKHARTYTHTQWNARVHLHRVVFARYLPAGLLDTDTLSHCWLGIYLLKLNQCSAHSVKPSRWVLGVRISARQFCWTVHNGFITSVKCCNCGCKSITNRCWL